MHLRASQHAVGMAVGMSTEDGSGRNMDDFQFASDLELSTRYGCLGIASGAGQFLLVLIGTGFGAFIVSLVWLLERFVSANSPLET